MAVARQISLIVNPSSGNGKAERILPDVEAALRGHGVEVTTERTRSMDHARELAVQAHDAGLIPVSLSGDGLLGAIAGALDGRGATIGVLPGGRGNDFARVAGIPLDAVEATRVIADGVPRPVDLGCVGDMPFVGIASLGFDSDANRLANEAPSFMSSFAYTYAGIRAALSWKHATFTVTIDGSETTFRGWTVAVANSSAYGGGMFLAPDAKFDDGLFDVVLSAETGKLKFLSSLPKVFKGEHVHEPSVTILRGREVRIEADRPFDVYADGDPLGSLPATVTMHHHAVQVLLPA